MNINIEKQVLTLEQIKELEKLGFDVEKYASMCWVKLFDHDNFYRILNKEYAEYIELNDYIPILTIGDIIEVLPEKIEEDYFLSVNSEYCAYSMIGGIDTIFFIREKELINNLFKTLVWCIKNKYIAL